MLLTGYGLEPVPRRAAGWGALASDRTPPAAWAAARRALGLSRRQAVAVAATKLLLWHWSQVRGRRALLAAACLAAHCQSSSALSTDLPHCFYSAATSIA
jgi:hypothetical protein